MHTHIKLRRHTDGAEAASGTTIPAAVPGVMALSPTLVVRGLAFITVVLILASVAGQLTKFVLGHERLFGLVDAVDLDLERNVPSSFSGFLMCLGGLLLGGIALLEKHRQSRDWWGWAGLAVGFMVMALDEIVAFHEGLSQPVREVLKMERNGIFYFTWIVPALILVGLLAASYRTFFLRLPVRSRWRFGGAAVLFLGGSLGVEMLSGVYADLHGVKGLGYALLTNLEESLELVGLVVFVWALLKHLEERYGEVRIVLGTPQEPLAG
jgi:hypothetical protein